MNRFDVRIHESSEPNGLKLADLERRLLKYFSKKKAQEPISVNGATNYVLRNGLVVNLDSRTNGILQMLVAGDPKTFEKSIEAVRRIYTGAIKVDYLQ